MKKFILYCFIFLLPLLIVLSVGEYMVREVPNPYKYKEYWMEHNAKKVETLVMGSSHAFYGINPKLLGRNAFSLANVSQDLHYDKFLINKFSQKCHHLRTIIIPISSFTLFGKKMEDGDEWYRSIFYKIYMDCPDHSDFSRYNLEISNLSTFQGKLKKYFNKSDKVGYNRWGWGDEYTRADTSNPKWDDATAAIERHTVKDFSNIASNTNDLKDIAEFCKKRDIRLILITTPTWHTYNEGMPVKQMNEMYREIKLIQKKYHVEYFNYFKDKRFEAKDFHDCDHLSTIGASKFTKILRHDINNIHGRRN